MKKHPYRILLLVLAATLMSSCGGKNKAEENTASADSAQVIVTQAQFRSMKMEIAPLLETAFDATVKASGKVDVPPGSRAQVTSFVGGYVKSIFLLVGNKVTEGQPLLTLESPDYIDLQQSYLETAGRIDYLRSEYERQKTLFDEKISSQKKYLEAESNYKRARAAYESLRRKLTLLRIDPTQVEQGKFSSHITAYAPLSGDITAVNVNVGMAVSPADVMVEIVDTQAMYLELSVFEKDIFHLKVGQQVKFTVPQVSSQEFEAEVTQIGKSVTGDNRVIPVYASLPAATKQQLLTGMFVEARLIASTRNALSVPFEAITTEEGNSFLLVLESEKDGSYTFRKTLVKTGERSGDRVEVILGETVRPDTKVLVKGVYDVL